MKVKAHKNFKKDLEFARKVHDHVLLFQRRMRKARFDYTFPVSNDVMLLLMLLSSKESITATEISKILVIPKAKVSRHLIALEESGYIETKGSVLDRRAKKLCYTEKGQKLFSELLRINNDVSMRGIHPLKGEDRNIFERFFRGLNDGLGFSDVVENDGELPLWIQQRRIASASGMVGTEYMSTGLDISEYQILFELRRNQKAVKFSDIDSCLPFHVSKISRSLGNLKKKGLIKKAALLNDKRGIACELTDKGKDFFKKIEEDIAIRYLEAFNKIDHADINAFVELMSSLSDAIIPPPSIIETELVICKTKHDFFSSRQILVEILVEKDRHKNLSSNLIAENCFCLQYLSAGSIIGVLVINKKSEVEFFEIKSHKAGRKEFVKNSFKQGLEFYKKETGIKDVHIPKEIKDRV